MKALTSLLLVTLFVDSLSAQENYNADFMARTIDSAGTELFAESASVKIDDPVKYVSAFMKKSEKPLLSHSEKRSVALGQLRRKVTLICEANRQLHFEIQKNRAEARRANSLAHREQVLSDAWSKSPTGMLDGRLWNELPWDEREEHRKRFVRFHSKKGKTTVAPEDDLPGFSIPQQEYASAWECSPAGKKDGRKWSEVTDIRERNRIRKAYYNYKLAFLGEESETLSPSQAQESPDLIALYTKRP
jgi:hypothetical protein